MRLCLRRADSICNSHQKNWMQAPTVGHLEALKESPDTRLDMDDWFVRQIEEPSRVVVFSVSDHAGCLKTLKRTSSFKLIYGSHTQRSTSTTQRVIAFRSGESEFQSLVKGTSEVFGAVSMLKDLEVDIIKNTKIDKSSTGDQSDEHWRDFIATFVKEWLESSCEQECEKTRNPILRFSLLTKRKCSWNSVDHESSDEVKLKQLRDHMVSTHRESPRSTNRT